MLTPRTSHCSTVAARTDPASALRRSTTLQAHGLIRDKTCRYPRDKLIATLRELAERLPGEALAVKNEFEKATAAPEAVTRLVNGLALQCKAVLRSMSATTNSK